MDILSYMFQILENIEKNQKNNVLYISIGSAGCRTTMDPITKKYDYDDSVNQQFPLFLQSCWRKYNNEEYHIFLIDEHLEKNPFMICDEYGNIGRHWKSYVNFGYEHYKNNNINVYPIRKNISYHGYNDEKFVDLTVFFQRLNEMSRSYQWLSFIHDFTGRNIAKLKYYFNLTSDDNKHIIYGLGSGCDDGCHIDMSKGIMDFVFDKNHKNNTLSVIVPHAYENKIDDYIKLLPAMKYDNYSNYIIMKDHLDQYFKNKKELMKNILSIVRQTKIRMSDPNICSDVDMMQYIDYLFRTNIYDLYIDGQYDQVYDTTKKILCDEMSKLISDKMYETLEYMYKNFDPYKWNDNVTMMIDMYIEKCNMHADAY
mgnify:CR=1 FL=1